MENIDIISDTTVDELCDEAAGEALAEAEAPTLEEESDEVRDALSELFASHPEITSENAGALCNLERYRELRALGLDVEEAYRATSKRGVSADSRSHLSVSVGGGGAPSSHGIPEPELRSARDIFSDMSDAEIRRLYKRVTA